MTGEIIIDEAIDAIIAGTTKRVSGTQVACRSFNVVSGIGLNAVSAVNATQRALDDIKKMIVDRFIKFTGTIVSFDKIARAAEGLTTQIEGDEEAFRNIMERNRNECEC